MGGMKASGLGRRHGREGLLKYTESRTVAVRTRLAEKLQDPTGDPGLLPPVHGPAAHRQAPAPLTRSGGGRLRPRAGAYDHPRGAGMSGWGAIHDRRRARRRERRDGRPPAGAGARSSPGWPRREWARPRWAPPASCPARETRPPTPGRPVTPSGGPPTPTGSPTATRATPAHSSRPSGSRPPGPSRRASAVRHGRRGRSRHRGGGTHHPRHVRPRAPPAPPDDVRADARPGRRVPPRASTPGWRPS